MTREKTAYRMTMLRVPSAIAKVKHQAHSSAVIGMWMCIICATPAPKKNVNDKVMPLHQK
jgi:hypothetical protein